MTLLERVTLLIKANLNDLVDQAESPEKLMKQLLRDMENQYVQVKTQLAAALANQHQLDASEAESREAYREWLRKAEVAIGKGHEPLARAAAERALTHGTAVQRYAAQRAQQGAQIKTLRDALEHLEQKIAETRTKADLLIAQRRRTRSAPIQTPSIDDRLAAMDRDDKLESLLDELRSKGRRPAL